MPEGHTIRALGDTWLSHVGEHFHLLGADPHGISRREIGDLSRMDNRALRRVAVKGKHLFLGFGLDRWLHIHLGRFGKFQWHHEVPAQLPVPKDSVRLRFVGERSWIDLIGPIACRVVTDAEKDEIESRLGPDPLRDDAEPALVLQKIQATKKPIGEVLMDQHVIAGIGNIYRAEVLWRSHVDPYRPSNLVDEALFEQLWADTKLLLNAGVRDHTFGQPTHTVGLPLPDGSNPIPSGYGPRGNHTQVYGRTDLPCARCGTTVKQADMAGRTLFWCPGCQL